MMPASRSGSSGATRIVAVLGKHGIAPALAEQIARLASGLRRTTRREGIEVAATINLESGEPVGSVLRGSGDDVDFEPHRRLLRPGTRYVALHTHPRSTPPSHKDFLTLVTVPELHILIVVGADGTWYIASRHPDTAPPESQAARVTFAAAFVDLRPHYAGQVQR